MRLFDAVSFEPDEESAASTPLEGDGDEDPSPEELVRGIDPPIQLGSCMLGREDIASEVKASLLHNQGKRYELRAWCIMPNHVHMVMHTRDEWMPDVILRDLKGYSSRQANKIASRSGSFWERESFDHLIRTAGNVQKFISYTLRNPVDAGLCLRPEDWKFSSCWNGLGAG